MADVALSPGILLIAPPALVDPNFTRAVVLLCDHTEEGSFGLIVNRLLDARPGDFIDGVDRYTGTLGLGGPVQTDTLHYLHRHHDLVTDGVPVLDGVAWGGDFEAVKSVVASFGATSSDLRFFLGYAGWGSGQLEAEVDQGGWILSEARPTDIFSTDPTNLWRSVMRRQGGEYALLSNFPDDPRLN